jgi:hypothetical protein
VPNRAQSLLCISLFFIFLTVGTLISSHKPLWNDEDNTQVNTINLGTYRQIIFSGIQKEGNKAPLFYLQQKVLCDLFLYYDQAGNPTVSEKILLRIPTVVEISLFLCILFYFFSRRFNLWFGFLSIFIALSSLMLWWYWAEARPYGLWVLLTACQMLLFIVFIEDPVTLRKHWLSIALIHLLLILTCVMSFIQIAVISAILLFKAPDWKRSLFLLLLPLALGYYYKPPGPENEVIFTLTVDQMLRDNIARDRLFALYIYPFLLLLYSMRTKLHFKISKDNPIVNSLPVFLAVFSMILITVVFLGYLREHALNQGQYIVSRHIIFLLPVGIIALTYLAGIIWESFKSIKWLKILLIAAILILLFYRIEKVIIGIKQFLSGLHG